MFPDIGTPLDLDESADPGPASHDANTTSKQRLKKRTTTSQPNAPADLRFISQPKGAIIDDTEEYSYDDSAGEGITVYVVDSGANPDNPDFDLMEGEIEWLWPTEEEWNLLTIPGFDQPYKSETDPSNHGSCVISKVAGYDWGVAKRANIVVVKVIAGSTEATKDALLQTSLFKSMSLIQEDIMARAAAGMPVNGKAVVNFSFGWPLDPTNPSNLFWIQKWEQAMQTLLALDVVIVAAAGNQRVSNLFYRPHSSYTQNTRN